MRKEDILSIASYKEVSAVVHLTTESLGIKIYQLVPVKVASLNQYNIPINETKYSITPPLAYNYNKKINFNARNSTTLPTNHKIFTEFKRALGSAQRAEGIPVKRRLFNLHSRFLKPVDVHPTLHMNVRLPSPAAPTTYCIGRRCGDARWICNWYFEN